MKLLETVALSAGLTAGCLGLWQIIMWEPRTALGFYGCGLALLLWTTRDKEAE